GRLRQSLKGCPKKGQDPLIRGGGQGVLSPFRTASERNSDDRAHHSRHGAAIHLPTRRAIAPGMVLNGERFRNVDSTSPHFPSHGRFGATARSLHGRDL